HAFVHLNGEWTEIVEDPDSAWGGCLKHEPTSGLILGPWNVAVIQEDVASRLDLIDRNCSF
ncbi:MAG TPA: hypothetical protein VNL98_12135, partial [Gemmatimonadales bacterium]|nr:hypothetical protein [Gemmatimonadales bacterium]